MTRKLLTFFTFLCVLTSAIAQQNIFDAARNGDLDTIKKLYDINPNSVDQENEQGYSPLVLACYHGRENIVAFLADKVKKLNAETSYGSPLMAATYKGYVSIVSLLLNHKVNPNLTDEQGTTAAHYAVLIKNYDIIEQLVKANADFTLKNKSGKSAEDYANTINDEKINMLLNLQK